jgi:hypothetical protein
LHQNFENLNPIYDKLRFGRAQDLADHWLGQLGGRLVKQVKDEKRKNFIGWLKEGNKLTFKEI